MNKFKEVAALFGLELGEEFECILIERGETAVFRECMFTDNGLIDSNGVPCEWLLCEVIKGSCEVEKLPWKPKLGEMYWYVFSKKECSPSTNTNEMFDHMCFKLGNYFKTKEEAKQNIDKIMNMLEG